ncbi:MAG: co-chaperone GroES [Candidatus Dojkabacteria bacterium]|uniref:Co-chaperonin GroES n=2 Tax=Candidatus Dojkabacteria TaxID=74243 RepID=A0A136KJY4_9BACT|nr:MAG: 10 kDa chaperonin [candidate division WS6 bacterium OLB21]MBW7953762.1 co-chaperone GroES [Candidatus Dojkabacteria bacterium]WKZ27437.1 MAG: co-chaperone GroES [Candidatus Dojkabacteria bacterium]
MAKAKLTPIGGNILVKPVSEENLTASGIVLPDTVDKEKSQKGEIVALGSGKLNADGKLIPFNVKVGDKVLFKKYSPEEIEVDGEDFLIMGEDAILAIIK